MTTRLQPIGPTAAATHPGGRPLPEPEITDLTTAAELAEASGLYREVFGYVDPQAALNPRLLLSMRRHGGILLGARDAEGRLVAFAYGWTGLEDGRPFHYSQAVVIAREWRSRGLGRRVKQAQRERALALGLATMRWSFDPLLAANAHFNLDVLGAVGHEAVPDLFGPGEHRLVLSWDLSGARHGLAGVAEPPETPAEQRLGEVADPRPGLRTLLVPAQWGAGRDGGLGEPEMYALADRVVRALQGLSEQGYQAVGCRRLDAGRSIYLLTRGAA